MIRYSNFILHMQGEPISIWRWTELPMRVPFFWLQTPSYTTANLHTSLFTVSNFNWYPLWRNYLCWYKYLKKKKKGKKRTQKRKITEAVLLEISLCMILGVRRDSEREVLDTHHILLHNIAGVSWTLLTYSLCLFFFKLQVFALLSCLSFRVTLLPLQQQISGSCRPFLPPHILPGAGGIMPGIPPDIPVLGPNRI